MGFRWAIAWLALLALACGGGGATAAVSASVEAAPPGSAPSSPDAASPRPPPADRAMILVPEGTFVMGWDAGEPDERPAHAVSLDAFYIDQFEVTVGQ